MQVLGVHPGDVELLVVELVLQLSALLDNVSLPLVEENDELVHFLVQFSVDFLQGKPGDVLVVLVKILKNYVALGRLAL